MRFGLVVLGAALCLIAAGVADSGAHGSHGHHQQGQAVIVTLAADHGPAPAGWRCTVFAPDGTTWTEGTLDGQGRIAFVPDRTGTWSVRAYAADGHGAELTVVVDDGLLERLRSGDSPVAAQHAAAGNGTWSKLAVGIAVLLGIFGCVALIQARRQ